MTEDDFIRKSMSLSFEFHKYLMEHPEFEEKIPDGAEVVIFLDDDPDFNARARALADQSRADGQDVVFVHAKGLAAAPASRLLEPKLAFA